MESAFKGGGTPVTLTVVQGKGHEWLFGENELQALDLWLQERTRIGARPEAKGWRPKLGEQGAARVHFSSAARRTPLLGAMAVI
jgi:hypothetical protein